MKAMVDVCYNQETEQHLDIYLPDNDEFSVMLYFHGGGLEDGDKSGQKRFLHHMVSQGFAVVSANYRMYPKAKYPDFLVEAADAVAWVFQNMGNYGKVKGIYVSGTYCAYVEALDENGESAFGKMVATFIQEQA